MKQQMAYKRVPARDYVTGGAYSKMNPSLAEDTALDGWQSRFRLTDIEAACERGDWLAALEALRRVRSGPK